MTDAEIYRCWLTVANLWPNYRLPEQGEESDRLEAWRETLGDLPYQAVRGAMFDNALVARDFCPPLGEIRDVALAILAEAAEAESASVPDTDQAWAEGWRLAAAVGFDGDPQFSHPAIAAAVASIGWHELCRSENVAAVRARFFESYALAAERFRRAMLPPSPGRLKAVANIRAGRLGMEPERPALGDGRGDG